MKIARIKALFKREITDILRDKKTLVMMVVIPMLIYPLMIITMSLVMTAVNGTSENEVYKVAFVEIPSEAATAIENILRREETELAFEFLTMDGEKAEAALTEQSVHIYLTVEEESHYLVYFLSAKNDSEKVADMVMDGMEIYRDDLRIAQVEKLGLDRKEILEPITYTAEDQSSSEETIGYAMGGVIPMMMILSIVMGAIYPAIDVTAGEKERGTLETLITLPVTSFEMIMSKFLAVALVACVSAILNIASMSFAMGFLGSMMSTEMGIANIRLASFLPAVLITVVVMLFFALFVTAVSLFVCLFAKSFKEANNYATPVMLIFVFAGYAGMLPGLKLTAVTAGLPIINIVLMVKQLFSLEYNYVLFGIVLMSNAVYSFLMMWLLARVYNSEAILFGEGFSGVRLFEKRSEMKAGQMPGYGDIVLLICGIFLLFFYIGNIALMKWGVGGVAVNQAIMLVTPVLYAWYLKNNWKRLFSVKIPQIRHLAGGIVLWLGIICLLTVLTVILMPLMPESVEAVDATFSVFDGQPFIVMWLIIALMPAVGEELLFRGFVFGTLREKSGLMTAMVLTSVIFALFHMSLIKFFTTFILGFLIVLAVQRSKSILVGMLIHLINNTFAVVGMKYPAVAEQIPLLFTEELTVGQGFLLLAVGAVGIGLGLLMIGKEKELAGADNR